LEDAFINWVEEHNLFCNSLVDRIVPGKPDTGVQSLIEEQLGYSDTLLTISEVYRLWAIEGNEQVKGILSFAQADEGIIIEPDINVYRELKLHLLNGTHTLSCGLAFLAGCATVSKAMNDEQVFSYIVNLMFNEIVPSIPSDVGLPAARDFGNKVLDRFRNPHISHRWINISMQYSSKMKARCIPVLMKHYRTKGTVPEFFALGFAAYLHFMKPVEQQDGQYYGRINDENYLIQDDEAEVFYKRWTRLTSDQLVQEVLRDTYWEENLHELSGFEAAVTDNLNFIMNNGIRLAIERLPFEEPPYLRANKIHNTE
jgi:tagaturonate reductase